jgi:hypothetical protein
MTATISGDGTSTLISLTTSGNTVLGDASTDTLNVGNGGLVKDASGNVGIGTSSPSYRLDVNGSIRGDTFVRATGGSVGSYLVANSSGSFGIVGTATNHPFLFNTNDIERMRIDTSGNLLVGTTSNPDTNRVAIKGGDGNQLYLDNAGSTYTQLTFANNGTRKVRQFFDNSLTRFYIDCNGSGGVYLSSGATSWTAASDERVKDIIEPIENATQKLSEWRTVVGKYKADAEGTRRSFLIAQDVLATFPEAVDTTNADEYGLNYQDLIPVLVKAIKEQQALITTLTDRITALEAKG